MIIGCDPGLKGAVALLRDEGQLVDVWDMPVVDGKVDAHTLYRSEEWEPYWIAVIEDVHAMPKQGVSSSFGFGRSKGVVEGVFAVMRTVLVSPAKWKRDMGLTSDKHTARGAAIARWPAHADKFKLVQHDGRAEAALLAEWFRLTGKQ